MEIAVVKQTGGRRITGEHRSQNNRILLLSNSRRPIRVDVKCSADSDLPDFSPSAIADPGLLGSERGEVPHLPHGQLISTTAPLMRFAPDDLVTT